MILHALHHAIHGRLVRHQCWVTKLAPLVPAISAALCQDPDGCRLIPILILMALTRLRGIAGSFFRSRRVVSD
jgi:hypothetical protein